MSEMTDTGSAFADEAAAPARSRRVVFLAGGVAVAVALAGGAFLLLGGGGGGDDIELGVPPQRPVASATPEPSAEPTPEAPLLDETEEPQRHDPFRPLYPPKPPESTDPPVPTDAPTDVPTGWPTAPGGGSGGGGVVGGGGQPGATQNVVALLGINIGGETVGEDPLDGEEPVDEEPTASPSPTGPPEITVSVTVDGQEFEGKVGDTLGSILLVVAIRPDDGAATFQLGEVTFDLRIGQSFVN